MRAGGVKAALAENENLVLTTIAIWLVILQITDNKEQM